VLGQASALVADGVAVFFFFFLSEILNHLIILEIIECFIPLLGHLGRVGLSSLRLCVVLVEVARVRWASQVRHDRTVHSPVVQVVPIYLPEPRMGLDSARAALNIAQALGGVHGAKTANKGAGVRRHGGRIADAALDDSATQIQLSKLSLAARKRSKDAVKHER
jgi:hypothetical protein